MKVLVTSSAMISHFAPLIPFLEALRDSRHDVLLLAPPEVHARAAGLGVPMLAGAAPDTAELESYWQRFRSASPNEASVIANREIFAGLNTRAMLLSVEAAVREHRPDLVLHEVTEYAGPAVAVRAGIPHAQVAISMAEAEDGSLRIAEPELARYDGLLPALRSAPFVTRFPAEIDPSPYPDTRRYRDPEITPLEEPAQGAPEPLVYVTFGTVAGAVSRSIFDAAIAALAPLPVRVLVTTGQDVDLGPVPDHVQVRRWVEQRDVLAHAAVVLCHGGSGTTLGALAAGVPMVIYPMFADQRRNAAALERLGVARTVEPDGESAAERAEPGADATRRLRMAVEEVLADGSMRAAAAAQASRHALLPTPSAVLDVLLEAPRTGR